MRRVILIALFATISACENDTTGAGGDAFVLPDSVTPPPQCKVDTECTGGTGACAINRCLQGQCKVFSAGLSTTCDDGNACTKDDHCVGSTCGSLQTAPCSDGNPCTDDTCVPDKGCSNKNNTAPCEDGTACTTGDVCSAGKCTSGKAVECDDGNPCTKDGCTASQGCTVAFTNDACDDKNACTQGDTCAQGSCKPGDVVTCDDKNGCTDDSCDPGKGCVFLPNSVTCEDGSVCTSGDACKGGACLPGAATTCDDGDVCTDDSCDKVKGCSSVPGTAPCTDGDACTTGDACKDGTCVPGVAFDCNDNKVCPTDSCNPVTGCVNVPTQATCTDGDACTLGDACQDGACLPGVVTTCDDANPCSSETCDTKSGCVYAPATATCTDADACTAGDHCDGVTCVAGTAIACDDGNPCTADSCDKTAGCVHQGGAGGCSDGDACTLGDACTETGACLPGTVTKCDDGNVCTTDSCDKTSGCKNVTNTLGCDDGSACTTGDMCMDTKCTAMGAKNCDDGNACTADSCDGKTGCKNVAQAGACQDGSACTVNDVCDGTTCKAGTAANCNDNNACTTDSCDAVKGCQHANVADGATCDDGNANTGNDKGTAGQCAGQGVPTCVDYCAKVMANCTSTFAQYASKDECLDYCGKLAKFPVGKTGDQSGDSIGCRLYHATVAAGAPATHCVHAGKSGGSVCGTLCENYCDVVGANCASLYTDNATCKTKCATAADTGNVDNSSGANVFCYLHYAAAAGTDGTQCSNAAIPNGPGGKCVSGPQTWTVKVGENGSSFTPSQLTIKAGDTVNWEWVAGFHSVTSGSSCTADNKFSSGAAAGAPKTYSHTFPAAGAFPYFCIPHCGGGMTGTITVQ